jgi:transposase
MPRPSVLPAEEKFRIVLAVLTGAVTLAEAARRSNVSEQTVSNWRRRFLAGGRAALAGPATSGPGPTAYPGVELTAEADELRDARIEVEVWRRAAGGVLPPVRELEEIRLAAGLPVSRYCRLISVPRRTYTRWLESGRGTARQHRSLSRVDRRRQVGPPACRTRTGVGSTRLAWSGWNPSVTEQNTAP